MGLKLQLANFNSLPQVAFCGEIYDLADFGWCSAESFSRSLGNILITFSFDVYSRVWNILLLKSKVAPGAYEVGLHF